MALHLPTGPSKHRSGLHSVPRCEPSTLATGPVVLNYYSILMFLYYFIRPISVGWMDNIIYVCVCVCVCVCVKCLDEKNGHCSGFMGLHWYTVRYSICVSIPDLYQN